MQSIAEHRGGKCLSKEYINSHTPLEWMCKKGHTWDSSYSLIQQGRWCAQCLKNSDHLATCQELAKKKGGKCLSENYVNSETKLKFECKRGHTFLMTPHILKADHWCRKCFRIEKREKDFKRIKGVAKKKGFICLSNNYQNKNTSLKWKCENNHTWNSKFNQKLGCSRCKRQAKCDAALQKLQKIAQKKGGLCLSKEFKRIDQEMKWKCAEGHIFTAMAKKIKWDIWCPVCNREIYLSERRKYTVAELNDYAKKQGGEMLSKSYKNSMIPVKWKCRNGHIWDAVVLSVVERGSWCRKCNTEKSKLSIDEFHAIAKQRGGRLLSQEYITGSTPLHWQCEKGHIWTAPPKSIKRGSWCPDCANQKRGSNLLKHRLEKVNK